MDLTSRIKKIIEHSGLTNRGFAIRCGLNQPTLDRMMKGINALNLSCVCATLNTFPDISAEWLMRGEGDMLLSTTSDCEGERINRLIDTIATLQSVISDKDAIIKTLLDQINQLKNTNAK